MAFVPDSNHPQPLWQPPPTAYLNASGAASDTPFRLLATPPPPHQPFEMVMGLLKASERCHCRDGNLRTEPLARSGGRLQNCVGGQNASIPLKTNAIPLGLSWVTTCVVWHYIFVAHSVKDFQEINRSCPINLQSKTWYHSLSVILKEKSQFKAAAIENCHFGIDYADAPPTAIKC